MLFPPDFVQKLEYLSLLSRRAFNGQLLAQRRSKLLGSGVEFSEHRQYTTGDDFRYLDWNLFARHDELLLKRFQEEQDLHLYLLLDSSRSMAQGETPKFDLARQMTAALAYLALADLDRAAVLAFSGGGVADFPLTRGKAQILQLLKFLERLEATGPATSLSELARAFVLRSQRRGMVIVVSDLFDPEGYESALNILRYHGYEVHVLHIYDRSEADPGLLGDVELEDVESGERVKRTITERDLRKYREVFTSFLESVRTYCRGFGGGCTTAPAHVPFDQLMLDMMRSAATVG